MELDGKEVDKPRLVEKYCEECQNLMDLYGQHEDCIRTLRAEVALWRRRGFLLGIMLLCLAVLVIQANVACGATWPIVSPTGRTQGYVREDFGNPSIDIFDNLGGRIGWGRRNPDGTVEIFDKDSRRIGTVGRGGVLRLFTPRKEKR